MQAKKTACTFFAFADKCATIEEINTKIYKIQKLCTQIKQSVVIINRSASEHKREGGSIEGQTFAETEKTR